MAFPLYVDENADTEIARRLLAKGIDVLRCQDAGMLGKSDEEHLARAAEQGRVLVTRDQDFLVINKRWLNQGKSHSGIIYILPEHQANVSLVIKKVMDLQTSKTIDDMRNLVWFV